MILKFLPIIIRNFKGFLREVLHQVINGHSPLNENCNLDIFYMVLDICPHKRIVKERITFETI